MVLRKIANRDLVILSTVMLVALIIRVWGTGYGVPYDFGHPDEALVVQNALNFGASKSLHPAWFNYPTLYMYLLFFVYGAYFLTGTATGMFHSVSDFAFAFLTSPGAFHLIGRLVTALIGALTPIVVYLLGKRAFGFTTGLVASLLLAFSPAHVWHSHWALPDVTMVFLSTLSFVFIYRILEKGDLSSYIGAGACAGLATSTKYNAGLLVLPIFMAHYLSCNSKKSILAILFDKKMILSYCTMAFGFLVGSPYWLFDFPSFYKAFLFDVSHMRTGHLGGIAGRPWLWHMQALIDSERILGFLFIGGVVYSLLRRERVDFPFLLFVLASVAYIGSWAKTSLVYLLATFPILAILGARLLVELVSKTITNRYRKQAIIGISLLAVGLQIPKIVQNNLRYTYSDTRVVAKEWVENNIPAGAKIAFEGYAYCPPLVGYGGEFVAFGLPVTGKIYDYLETNKELKDKMAAFFARSKTYRLYELSHTLTGEDERYSRAQEDVYLEYMYSYTWRTLPQLKKMGIRYIILSTGSFERYLNHPPLPLSHPLHAVLERDRGYFESLLDPSNLELALIKRFETGPTTVGPDISVYEVSYSSQ